MKFIWEIEDIKPGIIYSRPGLSECFLIGYEAGREGMTFKSISLSDGMICGEYDAANFAKKLK